MRSLLFFSLLTNKPSTGTIHEEERLKSLESRTRGHDYKNSAALAQKLPLGLRHCFQAYFSPTRARPLPHFAGSSRESFMAAEKRLSREREREGRAPWSMLGEQKLAVSVSWGRIPRCYIKPTGL